jgi:ABC-2 type transport system ATP-binding protein
VFSTHNVAEAERYAGRVLVLGDGELLFTGTPAEFERAVSEPGAAAGAADGRDALGGDLEAAFVRLLHECGH